MEEKIEVFQDSLRLIRLLCGLTCEDLAKDLGVTKQTISNLETKKVPMSKVMYIACRVALVKRIEEDWTTIRRKFDCIEDLVWEA